MKLYDFKYKYINTTENAEETVNEKLNDYAKEDYIVINVSETGILMRLTLDKTEGVA